MNLKANILLLISIGALSSAATAGDCNFDSLKGVEFQFDHISDFDRFSVRNQSGNTLLYPDWFYQPSSNFPIEYDKFFRRHGKLQPHSFLRKEEPVKDFANKTSSVRYYKATAENCEQVWVRINEDDPDFSRYFNVSDHKMDGDIPWFWEENTLNIRFTDQYKSLKNHVGKRIFTVPVTDNTIIPAYPIDSNALHAVPEFASLKLDSVKDNAFSVAGHLRSPYSLYVTDAVGEKWRLPWDPEYLRLGDPIKSLKLSKGVTATDIKESTLVYGMTKDEVRLAWGAPHIERIHPVIKDSTTGKQLIKNENYLIDGFRKLPGERVFPISDGDEVGQRVLWFYPNRLESGQHLIFDVNGKLKKSIQSKRIYKHRVQPVEIASERIRKIK